MLANLIREHALTEAQSGDWSAVAEILNAPTVAVRNPKSWTFADLIGLVGAEGAALVGGTIQAAGAANPIFDSAWIALSVTGLQLHTDERQQMIDGLAAAGNWPDQLRDTVKAAGLSYTSLSDATGKDCEAAWLLDRKQVALDLVRNIASEAAAEEYRKSDSTPGSIVAAAVAVLESGE
jgi:hypothetical protein